MESETNDRGSPDGRHSRSISSSSMSHDSALPTTATLHSGDLDDDNTDEIHIPSPSRSKSTDGRISRVSSHHNLLLQLQLVLIVLNMVYVI